MNLSPSCWAACQETKREWMTEKRYLSGLRLGSLWTTQHIQKYTSLQFLWGVLKYTIVYITVFLLFVTMCWYTSSVDCWTCILVIVCDLDDLRRHTFTASAWGCVVLKQSWRSVVMKDHSLTHSSRAPISQGNSSWGSVHSSPWQHPQPPGLFTPLPVQPLITTTRLLPLHLNIVSHMKHSSSWIIKYR